MGEGFSGHRWEWWVWALWQGLIAGGRMVPARKHCFQPCFSGESVQLVPDSLCSGARTPPAIQEFNLQMPTPCSVEAHHYSNDLQWPDRCLEISHVSKVRGKRIFLPSAASRSWNLRPGLLCVGFGHASSVWAPAAWRGRGVNACPSLQEPVGPHDAPALLCPEHPRLGAHHPPASESPRDEPGSFPEGCQHPPARWLPQQQLRRKTN